MLGKRLKDVSFSESRKSTHSIIILVVVVVVVVIVFLLITARLLLGIFVHFAKILVLERLAGEPIDRMRAELLLTLLPELVVRRQLLVESLGPLFVELFSVRRDLRRIEEG